MLHLKHESYEHALSLKNWDDWITTRWQKMSQPQKFKFWKKCPKIKKHIIFLLMTTFYNFDLKIETSSTKKVVKPILETWHAANDLLCMFGLFILW